MRRATLFGGNGICLDPGPLERKFGSRQMVEIADGDHSRAARTNHRGDVANRGARAQSAIVEDQRRFGNARRDRDASHYLWLADLPITGPAGKDELGNEPSLVEPACGQHAIFQGIGRPSIGVSPSAEYDRDVGRIFHAHPTLPEAIREAALAVDKRAREI